MSKNFSLIIALALCLFAQARVSSADGAKVVCGSAGHASAAIDDLNAKLSQIGRVKQISKEIIFKSDNRSVVACVSLLIDDSPVYQRQSQNQQQFNGGG